MRDRITAREAVATAYVCVLFMSTMDTTIVNVALPAIGRSFSIPPTAVGGISVGYLVSLAVVMPAAGWLSDRYGHKRVLMAATVVFTGASALCGLAPGLSALVAFRVLQGVGGGLLSPVGLSMLLRAYPPGERLRVSGLLSVPGVIAPAAGPVLGGLLASQLSWRWVFYVNVPVGIAVIAFATVFVHPDTPSAQAGRLNLLGLALSGAGLGLLMYGVCEGPAQGWSSPAVLTAAASGGAALAAMVRVELSVPHPVVALRLFNDRLFRSGAAVSVLLAAGFIGTLYVMSIYLQAGRGLSSLGAGLTIFPEALGMVAGSQLASRVLYARLGPRRHVATGVCALAAGDVLLAALSPHGSLWLVRLLMFGCGLSMSQVFVGLQTAAFATVSHQDAGSASTLFNSVRQVGAAAGVAVLTTVIGLAGTPGTASSTAAASPYRIGLLVAAASCLSCLPFALAIRDADAAATFAGRGADRAAVSGTP